MTIYELYHTRNETNQHQSLYDLTSQRLNTTPNTYSIYIILHTLDEYATSQKKGVKIPRSCNLFAGKL